MNEDAEETMKTQNPKEENLRRRTGSSRSLETRSGIRTDLYEVFVRVDGNIGVNGECLIGSGETTQGLS